MTNRRQNINDPLSTADSIRRRITYGDFQTPPALAADICRLLSRVRPATIVEPTCGTGAFLVAARRQFAHAGRLLGFDVNPAHLAIAGSAIAGEFAHPQCEVRVGDFFKIDWQGILTGLPEPILILGNPPWVTSAALSRLEIANHPQKENQTGVAGLDALTGKSNFDVSEWMISALLRAVAGRKATLAMLCKTSVARKVLTRAWRDELPLANCEVRRIDALRHFGANVDACLLICRVARTAGRHACAEFDNLEASAPTGIFGRRDGRLVTDVRLYDEVRHLLGGSNRWRSGVKHDCVAVFELKTDGSRLHNAQGERVNVEAEFIYPLLKSSQVAAGKVENTDRRVVLPQRRVGDDTLRLADSAPATWAYLRRNAERLDRRASAVYRNQPPFAVFGVGPYTFAPWKVAVSGFYESRRFAAVGPIDGRPVVFDDTCYFLPCSSGAKARRLAQLLNSDSAQRFFDVFVFRREKRPLTAEVLGLLDIDRLVAKTRRRPQRRRVAVKPTG